MRSLTKSAIFTGNASASLGDLFMNSTQSRAVLLPILTEFQAYITDTTIEPDNLQISLVKFLK